MVVARLKACRVGLHGNSTQAGRKWPCAKQGSGCCQTGRGVGLWGGRSLTERWVRGGSAKEGLNYPEVVIEEKQEAGSVARVPAGLSLPS